MAQINFSQMFSMADQNPAIAIGMKLSAMLAIFLMTLSLRMQEREDANLIALLVGMDVGGILTKDSLIWKVSLSGNVSKNASIGKIAKHTTIKTKGVDYTSDFRLALIILDFSEDLLAGSGHMILSRESGSQNIKKLEFLIMGFGELGAFLIHAVARVVQVFRCEHGLALEAVASGPVLKSKVAELGIVQILKRGVGDPGLLVVSHVVLVGKPEHDPAVEVDVRGPILKLGLAVLPFHAQMWVLGALGLLVVNRVAPG